VAIPTPSAPVRVRIAPSPTGDPHVGTAYIALFNKALAKKTGGKFILRIEDTDRTRYVAGSEQMIFDALRWLGLSYDEGPDVGGPYGPYRQSERSEIYRRATGELLARGKAYRCFCTAERLEAMRKEQQARKEPPGYDGLCRTLPREEVEAKLASGVPHVVRLAVPREGTTTFEDGLRGEIEFRNRDVDDQVLMKSDGLPTYHLANVVDDREMRITHVIRAEEWISSTPKHVLLYRAFGWEAPRFLHMPLLRNADKSKISKRKNPTSLIWYRDEGFLPEALLNFLGLMGYSMPDEREIFSFDEFVRDFDFARLKVTGPVFDLKKLEWLNGEYIRRMSDDDLAARVVAHFGPKYAGREDLVRRVVPIVKERIKKLKEWADYADLFFFGIPDYPGEELFGKVGAAKAREALDAAGKALSGLEEPFRAPAIERACRTAAEGLSMKANDLFMLLRVAVTGKKVSPPLFETIEILGAGETIARIAKAREKAAGS
jgi:glutamyl-tRNA synthetase